MIRTYDELLKEWGELAATASKIQNGTETGLSNDKIKKFENKYCEWYSDCLALLPDPLKDKFRYEFDGGMFKKIKNFIKNPIMHSVIHGGWNYSYESYFKDPFYNQKLLLEEAKKLALNKEVIIQPIELLEKTARKFHLIASNLQKRRKDSAGISRPTLIINDEYDAQDLFRSLLYLYFRDIRSEETMPSYAGTRPRADMVLKEEQIIIELKKTRENLKTKEIREQLILDKTYYSSTHPDCKAMFFLVYDPVCYIENPVSLENDLGRPINGIPVKVVIVQH